MKLKSYLRGLGLGMIVTTIILVIAFRDRNVNMTDEDVIARAYELGMVETSLYGNGEDDTETTTSSNQNNIETSGEGQVDPENNTEASEEENTKSLDEETTQETTLKETTSKETTTPETTTQETTTAKPEETTTAKPVETKAPTEAATTTAAPKDEYITILFENITTATKASTLLYEAGIIQDIESFNNYLSQKGWATKVGEGEFRFKKGMTFEEIAKIITRQN